jgi:hypothetical protein
MPGRLPWSWCIGALSACALALPAAADEMTGAAALAPPTVVETAPRPRHVLGLSLDAGVPDGAGISLHYRPWRLLRVGGGLLYNYVGYGVRGEVSILPQWVVAPALTLEAGHYFDANLNSRVSQYTTVSDSVAPLLERVGYTFANAQVGLEIGHPNWFVFFVRVGVGRTWLDVHGAQAAAQRQTGGDVRVTSMNDPTVRVGNPNAKLGFLFYFM